MIDAIHNDFLRSEVRTLRESFPYVTVLADQGDWPPAENKVVTYVIVAARRAPQRELPSAIVTAELDAFVQKGYSVVLTDDFVPVDQLLAPVFSRELHPPDEPVLPSIQGSDPEELMKAGLDLLYARNDPAGAAARFRRVLELNPTHYGATFQLARALDLVGSTADARPLWETVLRMAEAYHDEPTAGIARERLRLKP